MFDEDTPLVANPMKQPRRDLDLTVIGAAAAGVRSAVICPSLIYGIGKGLNPDSVQVPFLAANAREQGVVQVVGAGLNVWSNVHIDDVADLYLLALSKAPAGSFYFAENGEASFGEIGAAIAKRLGLPAVDPSWGSGRETMGRVQGVFHAGQQQSGAGTARATGTRLGSQTLVGPFLDHERDARDERESRRGVVGGETMRPMSEERDPTFTASRS